MILVDIILFLIVLGVNIAIHELAHFYFAKRADILCHEYAIGMGPAIYQKKKGETLYAIRAIPLGGYVSMAGEEVSDFVKEGNTVGIRLNEDGLVTHIILNNDLDYDFIGKVKSLDLYGEDNKELYLELNISGEVNHYPVKRDAMYVFSEKKEMQVAPAERSYESKTLWERFLVVIAGPVSNFLIALLILFFVGFFMKKPLNTTKLAGSERDELKKGDVINKVNGNSVTTFNELVNEIYLQKSNIVTFTINEDNEEVVLDLGVAFQGLGLANYDDKNNIIVDELVIGQVFGRSKNLKANDKILEIYLGKKGVTPNYQEVETWNDLINYIDKDNNHTKDHVYLKVLRTKGEDTEVITVDYANINSKTLKKLGAGHVGYVVGIQGEGKFNLGYSLLYPFKKLGSDIKNMAVTIGLLVSPKSGVGVKDLAGPVGIFTLVRDAKSQGVISFFLFFAFLSINVGFLNLLPIPALDGGRLVFIAYEAITKKKVNKNVENILITITFVLLLALMIFVMFNDVLRIFR